MHFPHFNSFIAALILSGMVTAAPIPQSAIVALSVDPIDVEIGSDINLALDEK